MPWAGQHANVLSTGELTQQPSRALLWLSLLYTSISRAARGWLSLVGRNNHIYCYWQHRRGFQKDWKIGSAFNFQSWQPLLHQLCLPFLWAMHICHHCALQTPVTVALPSCCLKTGCCPRRQRSELKPHSPLSDADLASARQCSRLCQPDTRIWALPYRAQQMLQPRKTASFKSSHLA